jgi:hypothetical protein
MSSSRRGGTTKLLNRAGEMRVSLLLNLQKKNTYRLFFATFSFCQHAACPLARVRESTCANGHVRVGHKKHRMEHKLSEIFEALRLSWV